MSAPMGAVTAAMNKRALEMFERSIRDGMARRCECGNAGIYPAPIGGGWSMVCQECRDVSELDYATHGDAGQGISPEQWDEWNREAK